MKKDVFGSKYHLIDQYGCERVELPYHEWAQTNEVRNAPRTHRLMQGSARFMRSIGDLEGVDAYIKLSKG